MNSELKATERPADASTGSTTETATPTSTSPANVASESQDFASVLESFEAEQAEQAAQAPADGGEIIKGTVINLTPTHVVVDIGNKSDGMVPIAQVMDREGKPKVQPGDPLDVVIDRREHEEGYILLSHERAIRHKVWDEIEAAYNEKKNIKGYIAEKVKGGVNVDIHGIKAFMPGSQVDARPARNLDQYIGKEIDVRIVKLNKKRGNVVVSHKAILDEENSAKREETLKHLEEGSVLTGTVKNLTEYGAFVDLGGIDGLLHITDMSWGRLTHPRDLVHVGDHIQVKVLKFDKEKQRVSLGFKQLTPDPWGDASERYPIGAHVKGRVLSVTDYGAFIELEQGIEGLVHVSEMTWSKRAKHPSKLVNPGQEVEAIVLNVNPTDRRISLGMKQLESNPWEQLHIKYPPGAQVEGKVRNLTDFGAFVEIEDGIDGLIHVSNMSWTKRVKHPSEVLKKGDKVKAVVLAIEPENRRLSLGMKQLEPDVWETFFATHRVGDLVKGKVLRAAQFGYFVEISEGIEGLCHNSEATDEHGSPVKLESGDEREFKIVKMYPEEKKVGLSLKAIGEEASRHEVEQYKSPSSSGTGATLGEIINWKQGR
ncbi:MAG TPA: 30S ribosomal protein S1 [Terriglobales bacterium]|nr:30S ribosomal protein S1 [Terriglobales bacterium]